ncbi:hypothetical protein CTI12_AA485540 [Artemisia annua]|uniref:Uncharacterized protein n=1 Tax=Artemisia annua TaxID=35608 RepID=A0A2U1LJ55_ARTAN|nr:hypothetical protein CTI12_AA485540 [Artemisia annua]
MERSEKKTEKGDDLFAFFLGEDEVVFKWRYADDLRKMKGGCLLLQVGEDDATGFKGLQDARARDGIESSIFHFSIIQCALSSHIQPVAAEKKTRSVSFALLILSLTVVAMRIKEKARRRVASLRSLECIDTPTDSAILQPKDLAALGKRPISHVHGPKEWSPSVGKSLCNSEYVPTGNPKNDIQVNLPSKSLKQPVHTIELNTIRKRKATQDYRSLEVAKGKSQKPSAETVPFSHETNAIDFNEHALNGSLAPSAAKKTCESVTEGNVIATHTVTEGQAQDKSCAHSIHGGSSVPMTPMTMDKGKQKLSELYSEQNCNMTPMTVDKGKQKVSELYSEILDDARQDFLCDELLCEIENSHILELSHPNGPPDVGMPSPSLTPPSILASTAQGLFIYLLRHQTCDLSIPEVIDLGDNDEVPQQRMHVDVYICHQTQHQLSIKVLHQHTFLWAVVTEYAIIAMLFSGAMKGLQIARACTQVITDVATKARNGEGLQREIVQGLIHFLDEHNQLVQLFRTARDKMAEADIPTFKVWLFGVVGARQYELPSGDSIRAIVFEGGTYVQSDFDIVIQQRSGTAQQPDIGLMHLLSYRKMDEGSSIVDSSKATGKEIMVQPENVSLADLTEADIGKTLYVKTYRKWKITNKHGKPVMFCCMLLDKQAGDLAAGPIEEVVARLREWLAG